jgi:hypothetical protein
MALIPLNTFRTITAVLNTATTSTVYTAPIGVTSIILMAQVSNIDNSNAHYCTLQHHRNFRVLPNAQGQNGQPPNVSTEIVYNFGIPSDDAGSLISGKLIIESQDSIIAYSNDDPTGKLKLILSVLETANS